MPIVALSLRNNSRKVAHGTGAQDDDPPSFSQTLSHAAIIRLLQIGSISKLKKRGSL
jgi:hypothetical protein